MQTYILKQTDHAEFVFKTLALSAEVQFATSLISLSYETCSDYCLGVSLTLMTSGFNPV